jgi:hypothetical protein
MRNKKQIADRVKRATIANELLAWMQKTGQSSGWMAYPMINR